MKRIAAATPDQVRQSLRSLVPFLAFGISGLSRRWAPPMIGNAIMATGGALSTVSLALFLTLRSWST